MPDGPAIAERPIPEQVTQGRARNMAPAAMVLALVFIVAALVAKPWSPSAGASPGVNGTTAPGATAPTTAPGRSAPVAPPVVAQGTGPIAALDWSRVSLSITPLDMAQVGVVTRSADGALSSSVAPLEPSEGTDVVVVPISVVAGRDVPAPNSIRFTAAGSVALVLAQPAGPDLGTVLIWRVVGASSVVRVAARHPVGDIDRNLWIYPPLSAPRGERGNLAEISASPPVWPAGVYRFDVTDAAGPTRYLFVILEPAGAG